MGAGAGQPLILVCRERPNAWNKGTTGDIYARFRKELVRAFDEAGRPRLDGLLYGIIYWFVRGYDGPRHPDADNISKPVWDMLSTRGKDTPTNETRLGAYEDDKQVRLRVAGIIDLAPARLGPDAPEAEQFVLPSFPEEVALRFDEFIQDGASQHFTYVECGPLRPSMFASSFVGGRG